MFKTIRNFSLTALGYVLVSSTNIVEAQVVTSMPLLDSLNWLQDRFKSNDSNTVRAQFVDLFPSSYSELVNVYYSNYPVQESNVYRIAFKVISNEKDDSLKFTFEKKLIRITSTCQYKAKYTSGVPYGDAGYLTNALRKSIIDLKGESFLVLSAMTEQEIRNVFSYLFTDLTPIWSDSIPKSIRALKNDYPHIYGIMLEELHKAKESDNITPR